MSLTTKKQWYAVYTRPRWEKKVADLLEKKKVEVYCPLNKVKKQWADRKKVIFEPLFTSYGVVNFVHWLSKPAVIRQEEIDTIRKFLEEYDNVILEKMTVKLNDTVRIINGPLMMWEGNVIEVRTNTVKITLPSLGQTLVAEIRKDSLEKIRPIRELHVKAV
jgi:transcription antitermination factor NusG